MSFNVKLNKYLDLVTDQMHFNQILSILPNKDGTIDLNHQSSHEMCFDDLDEAGMKITDREMSWETLFFHTLERKVRRLEPAPYFYAMVKSFIKIRRLRSDLIEQIKNDAFIKIFQLYRDGLLVAEKTKDRNFSIIRPDLYEECLRVPSESEINRHMFFLNRTAQNHKTYIPYLFWSSTGINGTNLDLGMGHFAGTAQLQVPYRKSLYSEEIGIFEEDLQTEYWTGELLMLRDSIKKQTSFDSFDLSIPWEQNHCVTVIETNSHPLITPVLEYLQGTRSLDEVGLTQQNASQFLTAIKFLDLAKKINNGGRNKDEKLLLPRESIGLRDMIFQLSPPDVHSFEVYTMTAHTGKMRDGNYWLNPKSWCKPRIALQAQAVVKQISLARHLSEGLQFIRVISGGTALGKSTLAPNGALNPDEVKFYLRQSTPGTRNIQIHNEGASVFKNLLKHILRYTNLNFVLDKRLKKVEDLQEIIDAAIRRQGGVEIIDLDGPLLTSLIRVLKRDPSEKAPCPSLKGIIEEGFKEIRKNRKAIVELIKVSEVIKKYEHFCFAQKKNDSSADQSEAYEQILVAKKVNGVFTVLKEDLYAQTTRAPSVEEINQQLDLVITPEFVEAAIKRGDIREEDRSKILRWQGIAIGKAVDLHSSLSS